MDYHYETQPVPGPTSRWYHQNPQSFHILETGSNHVIELIEKPHATLTTEPPDDPPGVRVKSHGFEVVPYISL